MLSANQDHAIEHLSILENEINLLAQKFELKLRRSPPSLRTHLKLLSGERLDSIAASMEAFQNTLRICLSEKVDPWDDREFFNLSMQSLRISAPKDFLNNVVGGDLIEGYDMNRFQIFRNFHFMEMSSYSLTEIISYEWPYLYDRAAAITEKMITYCDEILWTANRTIAFDIPMHFIRELRSQEGQLMEVRFKYLAPLFSGPNQPYGIVGTCRGKKISTEVQPDNLSFV